MKEYSRVLANGLHVTLIPNYATQIVEVQGWVRGGPAMDSRKWVGALVTSMLMRGTRMHSREEFEDMLDEHALRYNAGASDISGFFTKWSGKALPAHFEHLISLAYESLCFPSFPEEELKIVKAQKEAAIVKNASDPDHRAKSEIMRMLYGHSHPYFSLSSDDSMAELKSVARETLKSFWKRHYDPGRSGIVVVGDIDPGGAYGCIQEVFGCWEADGSRRGSSVTDSDSVNDYGLDDYEERTVFIPEKASALLRIGQRMPITSIHADYPALRVAVNALGGGMHARLFQYVREKHGLSYHVKALLGGMHIIPGYFSVYAHTNPDNISKTQEETWRVITEFCDGGITEEELAQEKAVWRGNRAISESSFSGIADRVVIGMITGVPPLELDKRVSRLTLDEVNGAIREYINPESMKVVRAGSVS